MKNEGGSTFELPTQPEAPEQSVEQVEERAIEKQRPAAQEAAVGMRAPQPGSTAVTDAPVIPHAPAAPAVPPGDDKAKTGPVSAVTADLKADDADLIEKEWIERARLIVAKTQDDPHRQKNEMSKAKADYIQKRFNKIIKTDEATA
ncbi:MAG TPA: hypothetical protein VIK37_00220 [Candidatus Saccharimonadales bacterium]